MISEKNVLHLTMIKTRAWWSQHVDKQNLEADALQQQN